MLDKHPKHPNIVIASACSGHGEAVAQVALLSCIIGFKLATVVGEVLADLATDKTPKYDMSPFKLSNFTKKPQSHL